jgi:hypothetical protein
MAWEPETRVRLVDEAIRMMPATLRLALESHRRHVLRGMLAPLKDEGTPSHRPPWFEGTLDRAFESEYLALLQALDQGASFSEMAERFGKIAHLLTDAGFPPGAGGSQGTGHYEHFSSFCESRRERFPVVFYGHPDPPLERETLPFVKVVMQRARDDNQLLVGVYAKAGDPPNPAFFDDRSVPFAVGSLAYSHTFTDIVSVWLAAWKQASGDMTLTPYLNKKNEQTQRRP